MSELLPDRLNRSCSSCRAWRATGKIGFKHLDVPSDCEICDCKLGDGDLGSEGERIMRGTAMTVTDLTRLSLGERIPYTGSEVDRLFRRATAVPGTSKLTRRDVVDRELLRAGYGGSCTLEPDCVVIAWLSSTVSEHDSRIVSWRCICAASAMTSCPVSMLKL